MLLTTFWVVCVVVSTYAENGADPFWPKFASQVLINAAKETDASVIVSPYSLLGPLSALAVGSAYSTRKEIFDALSLDDKADVISLYKNTKKQLAKLNRVKVNTANKIYITNEGEINHRFNTIATKNFDLQVEYIDFKQTEDAGRAIARWVKNNTAADIHWYLQPEPQQKAVLVNAVSLNAPWFRKFYPAGQAPYTISKSQSMEVDNMRTFGFFNYNHSEVLNAKVLSVPLNDKSCQLVIALPDEGTSVDSILKVLEADANAVNEALETNTLENKVYTNLTLPFIYLDTTTDMRKVLRKMGIERAFTVDAQVRRTLKKDEDVMLDEAIQKTFVKVNTKGIEGAASNDVNLDSSLLSGSIFPPVIMEYYVNRPFYVEIKCREIIVFNGIIKNPLE